MVGIKMVCGHVRFTHIAAIIFLLLSIFHVSLQGQSYNWKRGVIRGSIFTVAGVGAGLHETLQHPTTYAGFKRVFPNARNDWWNREVSWKRKYDHPYPLSETFPVFTDGYHVTAAWKTTALIGSAVFITIGEKRPWWHYVIDLTIGSVFYGIGSNATYQYFKYRGQ